MLYIVFKIGDDRYAIEASKIEEVLPSLKVRPLQNTENYIIGVIDYYGRVVPIIDMTILALGKPSQELLSTRILLIKTKSNNSHLIGLLAEGLTDTISLDEKQFQDITGIPKDKPYLGKVMEQDNNLIYIIDLDALLLSSIKNYEIHCKS